MTVAEKSYPSMTDDELRAALSTWEGNVADAAGWPSAYFAAKQVKAICAEGDRRGLGFENKYPIKVG